MPCSKYTPLSSVAFSRWFGGLVACDLCMPASWIDLVRRFTGQTGLTLLDNLPYSQSAHSRRRHRCRSSWSSCEDAGRWPYFSLLFAGDFHFPRLFRRSEPNLSRGVGENANTRFTATGRGRTRREGPGDGRQGPKGSGGTTRGVGQGRSSSSSSSTLVAQDQLIFV